MEKTKAKVTTKKLAFWETLIDVAGEPTRYLQEGEKVTILGNATTFGGLFGDKEYYKVEHPTYGVGYMRTEGLEVSKP
jgi:hypothetical protein